MREREQTSKATFHKAIREVVIPLVKETNDAFSATGDSFKILTEDQASALQDQIRTFCQVFYYPKGRGEALVGRNTASLLFECIPAREEVKVARNVQIRPAPLEQFAVVAIGNFSKEAIETWMLQFVEDVTKQ